MGWFWSERRGPEWKQGWTSNTLSNTSLPPLPLLAIFAIVLLFLTISQYTGYKAQMEHTMFNFQIFLFVLPVILIFVVRSMSSDGNGRSFVFRFPRLRPSQHHQDSGQAVGSTHAGSSTSSPWGVALIVVVLIVMIFYKSSFDSQWFRPLRRSD
ncbi:uncharacterized protein LOC113359891 [Papaver somniferum]|uniref:uncharacterized protein LOC113359891 n=1 Tax=Papaver somniferum TaxID=3469 RepID=UPI000E6FB41F|nr:uncharacterized protein LOC113359891 [Papaver somniferum]